GGPERKRRKVEEMRQNPITCRLIARRQMSRARRILSASTASPALTALTALTALSAPLHAQFFAFGQNKIQYRKLDWKIIRGPHVDLYYYPAEAELAPAALAYAEASYDTLSLQFGHEIAA